MNHRGRQIGLFSQTNVANPGPVAKALLWNVWMAEKGYKTRNGDYYELYHNDHMQHPEKKFILDICIPTN